MIKKISELRILYVVSTYKIGDGVSTAVYSQIFDNEPHNYLVVAKWLYSSQDNLNIVEYTESVLRQELLTNRYDVIHYLKGNNSDILNLVLNVVKKIGQNIPVLTTVCQNPTFNYLLLSPFELRHSSHFVFIDKASYNASLCSFIPEMYKSQIYLAGGKGKELSENVEYLKRDDDRVIFGRGSTLSKCPRDMFEVFDRIDCPTKEFHIVGVAKEGNWVAEEAKKRNNVVMYGFLPFNEWVEVCKSFDIYLYQLPVDSHASLDGTLGLAMWMRKPVVYYGCEAPKERFDHGVNGYVAETEEEIIKYSNLLAKDFELRKKIGQAGRDSIEIKIGTLRTKNEKYLQAYIKCLTNQCIRFKIPFSYIVFYTKRAWKRIIREITGIYSRPII